MNKKKSLKSNASSHRTAARSPESAAGYVDGEKNKKMNMKEAFLSLSDEEMFKYFDILKKSLSGTVGKNLLTMEFPLAEETEGGTRRNFCLSFATVS